MLQNRQKWFIYEPFLSVLALTGHGPIPGRWFCSVFTGFTGKNRAKPVLLFYRHEVSRANLLHLLVLRATRVKPLRGPASPSGNLAISLKTMVFH